MIVKKTYASIVKSLTKLIDDLEAHAATKLQEHYDHKDKAEAFNRAAEEAREESGKAYETAGKIRGLVA